MTDHAPSVAAPRDPGYPYGEFDASKWAAEFKRLFPDSDEGLMLAWFANAIMTGYDRAALRAESVAAPAMHEHRAEYPSSCAGCEHLAADLVSRAPDWMRPALAASPPAMDAATDANREEVRRRIVEWLGPQRMSLHFGKDIDHMVMGAIVWDALRVAAPASGEPAAPQPGRRGVPVSPHRIWLGWYEKGVPICARCGKAIEPLSIRRYQGVDNVVIGWRHAVTRP